MCHKRLGKSVNFIRKLPIIPSLHACLMDLLIILICMNYFDFFDLIWKMQLVFLVLKAPVLIKFYTEPLFPARKALRSSTQAYSPRTTGPSQDSNYTRPDTLSNATTIRAPAEIKPEQKAHHNCQINKWTILFILTFLTVFGNITLYVLSPD